MRHIEYGARRKERKNETVLVRGKTPHGTPFGMNPSLRSLEEAARYLAEVNHQYEPEITRTYWFPDASGRQIRLVHITPNALGADGRIRPFYFAPTPTRDGIAQESAIGMVPPEQECAIPLPPDWGDWNGAEQTWEWNP